MHAPRWQSWRAHAVARALAQVLTCCAPASRPPRDRSEVVATSAPSPLRLRAPPALAPFTPPSPGVLITLPARPLHFGETFTAVISATNPRPQGITSWSLPLRYSSSALQLLSVTAAPLWLHAATSALLPLGGATAVTISVGGRAAGAPPEAFRSASAIPLATVAFLVAAGVPGTYPGALTLGSGAALAPSWASPPVGFHDYRDGVQGAGGINVTAARTLGLWAWPERSEVFNTARFDNARVSTRLHAAAVRSFGSPAAAPVTPATCAAPPGTGGALSVDVAGCAVHVDAAHTAPLKDGAFTLGAAGLTATAVLSVWQPARVALHADDAVLNSVLPLNAAAPPPGCTERYQATRLRAAADWTNGGGGAGDVLPAADVSGLAAFAVNDSSVALVLGGVAHGIGPGAAAVGLAGFTPQPPPLVLTVTDAPACLLGLAPLATTGVALVAPPAAVPAGGGALTWRGAQQLAWEGATARVVTVARFSDGASMDVSDRAALRLAAGAAGAFNLSADGGGAPLVTVAARIAGDAPTSSCGDHLAAVWEVCSRRLGEGEGTLVLALPQPRAIAALEADPPTIAPAGDAAALTPVSLPTSAELSLRVSFSDGSVRDFIRDARATFAVAAGSSLCTVARGAGGGWRVTTAASGSSTPLDGGCTLAASVAFPGAPPLTGSLTVAVVALRGLPLYALGASALEPPGLPPPAPPLGPSLRLLRCDARNYDQRTLWGFAALTNCTGPLSGCPLIDVSRREWLSLASSDASVLTLGRGYPSDPGGCARARRLLL